MSLQPYVRQLNPRNESYTPPVDKIQNFLAEASMLAADWEQVIAVAYNMTSGMSKEQAISSADLKEWKPKYNGVLSVGLKIVQNSFGKSTKGKMLHYGQASGTISEGWDEYFIKYTGKPAVYPTNTPKTDMILSNANISLKKYGGSQLMSGGKAETLATLGFAYDNAPDSIKSKPFDNAWQQLNTTIADEYVRFKLPPGGQVSKISKGQMSSPREIKKIIKETMSNNRAMTSALTEIFQNELIKKEVVREAMSGRKKFSDKQAAATHMMKFGVDGSSEYIAIDDKLVSKYTNATSFNISFKTSGTGGDAWTALKGIYKEEKINLDDIIAESIDETDKEFLEEGLFSRAVKTVKNWIIRLLKKVWDKIKKFLMKSLDFALDLIGIKMVAIGDGYRFKGF